MTCICPIEANLANHGEPCLVENAKLISGHNAFAGSLAVTCNNCPSGIRMLSNITMHCHDGSRSSEALWLLAILCWLIPVLVIYRAVNCLSPRILGLNLLSEVFIVPLWQLSMSDAPVNAAGVHSLCNWTIIIDLLGKWQQYDLGMAQTP